MLTSLILTGLLMQAPQPQQDQCPAYLDLAKTMIADRDLTIEIQRKMIQSLQAEIAAKKGEEKKDGK